jgi:hypothetical protein
MRISAAVLWIGVVLGWAGPALAQKVDYFQVQLSGLEHCADLDNFKFGSKNSDPQFLRIVNDQEWDLSSTNIFDVDHTTPLIGQAYLSNPKKLVFTGGQFTDTDFIALDAEVSLDKNGVPTKVSGTFILETLGQNPNDPNDPNQVPCNQTGKFKSTQRVLVVP